jgi:3-methyladenine DNA glycosylase AlkC
VTYRLKDFFDARVLARIADEVAAVHPQFPRRAFLADAAKGMEPLELMDRGRHIMRALKEHLPEDPARAIAILERSLGPPLAATEGHGMEPFVYLPHVLFVAEHGLDCFEASMRAQHALTQRFSAEFSIRRFLEREPERTLAKLESWSRDPSPHVRRLVSEGTRPRLPWAGRLRAFQHDPAPVLALLERLRDDPHPYVRRSVANSLNDVGKDHPAVLVDVARRWLADATPERRRLVEHALRTAVKRGDPGALRALGFGSAAKVTLGRVRLVPPRPRIGEQVRIEVEVQNPSARPADVVVDLGVHFVKQNGKTAAKVFKLRTLSLAPRSTVSLGKTISLAQHTTRTHHTGRHCVDVRVNGRIVPVGSFTLRGQVGGSGAHGSH